MEPQRQRREENAVRKQLTAYREPVWLDALKTCIVALCTLGVLALLGSILVLEILSPWGRESFDCSIWCVVQREILGFGDAPGGDH